MATDNLPAWVHTGVNKLSRERIGKPIHIPVANHQPVSAKPVLSTQPAQASTVQAKALRAQTAAQSHNVFRPDIYRVSEGYLN
jgi:hypothetical protein